MLSLSIYKVMSCYNSHLQWWQIWHGFVCLHLFKVLLQTHAFLYIVVLSETARAVTPSQTNSGLKIGIRLEVGGANIVSAAQ